MLRSIEKCDANQCQKCGFHWEQNSLDKDERFGCFGSVMACLEVSKKCDAKQHQKYKFDAMIFLSFWHNRNTGISHIMFYLKKLY